MARLLKIVALVVLAVVVVALAAYGLATRAAMSRYMTKWTAHDDSFPIPFPLDSAAALQPGAEAILAAHGGVSGAGLEGASLALAEARGKHLVDSRLGCTSCHGDDFGGKVIIDVPVVGYWAAPNLTLGEGGVTSGFSAHDWDLAVRHGIKHTGTASSMPCEEFTNLSDHELSDVVAYIRSAPPVNRLMPAVRMGPVFAFLIAGDPKMLPASYIDHHARHAVEPPPAAVTAEYGEHLAQSCRGCHQQNLSGGKVPGDPNMPIVANITPDSSGIGRWSEDDFIRAMREGRKPDGSAIKEAMPWKSFGKMDDTEIKALWAYLRTVPPLPKGTKAKA